MNLTAPEPLPQREFMRALRAAAGIPIGLGGTRWMVEMAAVLHRTDPELLLKSRREVPARLLDSGFRFQFPAWPAAARDLVARMGRGRPRPDPNGRGAETSFVSAPRRDPVPFAGDGGDQGVQQVPYTVGRVMQAVPEICSSS